MKIHSKKYSLLFIFQFFIAQFVLNAVCWGNGLLEINVHSVSLVEHKKVRLGDIARITGDEPDVVKAAQSIVLVSAPTLNRSIIMEKGLIKKALLKNGFDLKEVKLAFPKKITVKNKLARITEDEIKESIREYIYTNMPWQKDQAKVSQIGHKGDIVLPGGEIQQKIIAKENSGFIGKVPLILEFKVNGKILKRKKINALVEVLMPTVLAKVFLKRGQIISKSDIYTEKQWKSKTAENIYNYEGDVIGKKVTRGIKAGQPLKKSLLKIPEDISRGDRVTILAVGKGLRITVPGIAGEKGRKGETIKVKNINSKKIIYARVIDSTTVKVDF